MCLWRLTIPSRSAGWKLRQTMFWLKSEGMKKQINTVPRQLGRKNSPLLLGGLVSLLFL